MNLTVAEILSFCVFNVNQSHINTLSAQPDFSDTAKYLFIDLLDLGKVLVQLLVFQQHVTFEILSFIGKIKKMNFVEKTFLKVRN